MKRSPQLDADLLRLRRAYAAALRGSKRSPALTGALADHVSRIESLRQRFTAGATEAAVARALFDALPFPAVVLDEHLKAGLFNQAWSADRESRGTIGRAARSVRARAQHPLADAIREKRRTFLSAAASGLSRPALVIPLRSPSLATTRLALVVIGSIQPPAPGIFAESAKALFGLTPAESAIAGGALAGNSLAEIAAARGTTLQTTRFQMKSILQKTGTSSRTALTGLLIQSLWQPGRKA